MAKQGRTSSDEAIQGVLLREIVEAHYPDGWDEFVMNIVLGAEDLAEVDIERWNEVGDVPSDRWQIIDAILGFPEGRVDYELLRPADPSAAEAAKEAKAREAEASNPNEAIWDGFDESMEDDDDEEEDAEDGGGEVAPEMSEGFEPPETEEADEPEDEPVAADEEDMDMPVDEEDDLPEEILAETEPEDEPEDVSAYFNTDSEPEEQQDSENYGYEDDYEPEVLPAYRNSGDSAKLIGRTVSYANVLFKCSDDLLLFIAYLIGVNGKPKDIREDSTEMVIKMMDSDISFFQDTAKHCAVMKKRGSVNLGVYVGSRDEKTFRALKQIASAVYTGDHVGSKSEVDTIDRHTLAETLDNLPDSSIELIDSFVTLDIT